MALQLGTKLVLGTKGEAAVAAAMTKATIEMVWKDSNVDFDAMIFGKKKDGSTFYIYSDQLPPKDKANLGSPDFIQHMGDDTGSGEGGKEVINIADLTNLQEAYVCVMNYTEAKAGNSTYEFASQDCGVKITPDNGDSIGIPLDSTEPGTMAIIAKIENGDGGPKLTNMNVVTDFQGLVDQIPQAVSLAG